MACVTAGHLSLHAVAVSMACGKEREHITAEHAAVQFGR